MGRSSFSAVFRLIRPEQWYKNLLVFLPLIFTAGLFDHERIAAVTLAGIGLCMISSAGYVFNDIYDAPSDRRNPEKRKRPLAARDVSLPVAAVVMVVLAIGGIVILWSLSSSTAIVGSAIFAMTLFYTLVLKHEPIIDVIAVSVNFVLRAAVGAIALAVVISPWLVLCTFSLSMILAVGKRLAETKLLGAAGSAHRPSLDWYSRQSGLLLICVSATLLLLSYALYSFLHGPELLMLTLPFAFYAVMRHAVLAAEGVKAARHPHLLIFDTRMMGATVGWGIITLAVLYAV